MTDAIHLRDLLETLKDLNENRDKNQLDAYNPYPKQREFHEMGAHKEERLLSAGNQQGKTFSGSREAGYHATGLYPKWWNGRVFTKETVGWVGGEGALAVRDTSQKLLLGDLAKGEEYLGTGAIPADLIIKVTWSRGITNAVDTVSIRHKNGKTSLIQFKSYEQTQGKWMGATIDWIWFDEEPPLDIYIEGLARFTATGGISWITFTPLKGMSSVVKRFKNESNDLRGEVIMTAHDALHITPEKLKSMLSKYPEHEHETRINGVPMQGEGRIFQLADSVIMCEPFEIPPYWTRIVGLDLGHGDHPTAAAWLAIDRDTDTIYIHKCYRRKGGNIPTHAEALKTLGRIPVAWPHDGNAPDKFEGTAVKKHYQNCGVNMLSTHATFGDGSMNVWQGVVELQQRMEQGRFKVFSTCFEWFEEFRNYHMEKGKIVKIDDDLLCATRYGMMMMRQAKPVDGGWRPGNNRFSSNPIAPGTDFNVFNMD